METMISLKDAGLIVLFIGLIILVIYLIVLVKNLIVTVKKTNTILDDTKVITDVAQSRTTDVDGLIDNVVESVSGISGALKGNEKTTASISSIAKAVSSVIGIIKDRKADKE